MTYLKMLSTSLELVLRLNISHYAAAFSYYAPFALVPLLLISLGVSNFFYGLSFVKNMFLSWGTVFGPDLTTLVGLAVQNLDAEVHTYEVPIIAVLFFSFVSILALNALAQGFEKIWGQSTYGLRGWLSQSGRSVLFIVILQIYILVLVSLEGLRVLFNFESSLIPLLIWFTSISVLFSLLYRFLVSRSPSSISCLVGGATAGLLFIFAKNIVTIYLAMKPVLNIFGAAGLILVLLVWVYVLAIIIYYGAIVAQQFELKTHSNTKSV